MTADDEETLLKRLRQARADDLEFFSNRGRAARELWVAGTFLERLGLKFEVEELRSEEVSSKVDVAFRGARFQIKEITEPGTRRTAEASVDHRRAVAAAVPEDAFGPIRVRSLPPPTDGNAQVLEELASLDGKNRYTAEVQAELDLLFYATRTRMSAPGPSRLSARALAAYRWRSVCCLMGERALVLHAGPSAPEWLRTLAPRA